MRSEPPFTAAQTEFLSAFSEWSGRDVSEFPHDCPPVGAVGSADEDEQLAQIFAQTASTAPYYAPSHSMAVLTAAIEVHQRRYDQLLNSARGMKASDVADARARRTWVETKPYKAMLDTLHCWLDAFWISSVERAA